MLRQLIDADIQMETQIDPAPLPVRLDRSQFELMVLNIAANARDAMLGGGRFSIAAGRVQTESGQCVEIGLADTGHGMSEEVLRRAFEPFYTTKPADSGTGLGLSVVRDLAENAGGTVEVVSTPGSGTLFRILLPLAAINQSDASSAPAAATETP